MPALSLSLSMTILSKLESVFHSVPVFKAGRELENFPTVSILCVMRGYRRRYMEEEFWSNFDV